LANGRFLSGFALAGFMLAVAGCQSGDAGSVLGFGGGSKQKQPEEGKVLASELRAYCPMVTLKEETGFINRYAKGGEGDAAKLSWQASINAVTRSCNRQTGMLAMEVALAGRVVPGPAGASGTVTLPIKITVIRSDGEVLYSQTQNHQVALAGNQAQQFLVKDSNVVVPIPADNTLQVFAGFDPGPAKKKQEDEELF
jgi:hypothetical protein